MQAKFNLFLRKFAAFSTDFSSVPATALVFSPAFPLPEGFVDENDIAAEPLDALPGNVEVLPPSEQAEKAARAKDNDPLHAALRDADLHISHIAQAAAIADIDDLLAP